MATQYFYVNSERTNIARVKKEPGSISVKCLGPDATWVFTRSAADLYLMRDFGKEISKAEAKKFAKKRFPGVEVEFDA